MNNDLHFSSKDNTWETPQKFYDELNKKFNFTLDPCCTEANTKCSKFFTIKEDGLVQSWQGEVVFMNPPYGREINKWIRKAFIESRGNCIVVGILPARTDTTWFHDYIYNKTKVEFIKGRLKFGGAKNSAPFPSMIVIWHQIL